MTAKEAPVSRTTKPKLAAKAKLKWDRHESKHMLLYPERGLLLNETAAAILELCDGARTVSEIADELKKKNVEPGDANEDIEGDVIAFLESLRVRALLESTE